MSTEYETSISTRRQLRSARVRGQVKGWAQGAGATVAVLLLLKIFGWIPAILLLGVIVLVGFGIVRAIRKAGDSV